MPRLYDFICKGCGKKITLPSHEGGIHVGSDGVECGGELRRDWKAGNVGFTTVPGGYRSANPRG